MAFRGTRVQGTPAGDDAPRVDRRGTISMLVAAIGASEIVLVFVSLAAGVFLHAFVLVVILTTQARWSDSADGRAIVPLALVPLLRVLSLTMALPGVAPVYWTVLTGAPLAIAGVLAARAIALGREGLGLKAVPWQPQAGIAALGLPAGLAIWLTGGTSLFLENLAAPAEIVVAVMVVVSVGVIEEFVFRGVVQGGLSLAYGRGAVWMGAILYGTVYLASLSPGLVVVMTVIGLLHGALVARSGSIAGVCGSHALAAVGALLVWPTILG